MTKKLYLCRRFTFAASHRYVVPEWSDEENRAFFGDDAQGRWGHGHNFIAYLMFEGPIHPDTGMILELSKVKRIVNDKILHYFDHHYLNDLSDFKDLMPTPENIAQAILKKTDDEFVLDLVKPSMCQVIEDTTRQAIVTQLSKKKYQIDSVFRFSVPLDSGSNNLGLSSVFDVDVFVRHKRFPKSQADIIQRMAEIKSKLQAVIVDDGVCLSDLESNDQVGLIRYLCNKVSKKVSINKISMVNNESLLQGNLIIYGNNDIFYTYVTEFYASHCLSRESLDDAENIEMYGKCSNPHGHNYKIEITAQVNDWVGGSPGLTPLKDVVTSVLSDYHYSVLEDVATLRGLITTGELVIQHLWDVFNERLSGRLKSLKLWETENNYFVIQESDD